MRMAVELARRFAIAAFSVALAISLVAYAAIDGVRDPLAAVIPLTLGSTLPLAFQRRWPFAAPLVGYAVILVWAAIYEASLSKLGWMVFVVVVSAWALGAYVERRRAIAGFLLTEVVVVVTATRLEGGFGNNLAFLGLFTICAWAAGFSLGDRVERARALEERAQLLELEREQEAMRAVAEERARIARELHDLVGHAVSVMTVQASGVRRLLREDQAQEREALLVVEQTGREALAEMRRLVGVLRRPEDAPALAPQPSLRHLERLVRQTRDAGLPVEVSVEGEPAALPPGLDLTAYRLVQEGLTNALKHARAAHAEVVVRYGRRALEVVVRDDGTGGGNGGGGGHGLVGMRERVAVYGGELVAGPRADGGFELRARLPLEHA